MIIFRLMAFCYILLTSGCMTTESFKKFYAFPENFTAVQALTIELVDGTQSLLANLAKEHNKLKVVFIHPILLIPIVEINNTNGLVTVKRIGSFDLPKIDLYKIFRSIQEIYRHRDFRAHFKLRLGDGLRGQHEGMVFFLSDLRSPKDCYFPYRIDIAFKKITLPKIRVDTKELQCH